MWDTYTQIPHDELARYEKFFRIQSSSRESSFALIFGNVYVWATFFGLMDAANPNSLYNLVVGGGAAIASMCVVGLSSIHFEARQLAVSYRMELEALRDRVRELEIPADD